MKRVYLLRNDWVKVDRFSPPFWTSFKPASSVSLWIILTALIGLVTRGLWTPMTPPKSESSQVPPVTTPKSTLSKKNPQKGDWIPGLHLSESLVWTGTEFIVWGGFGQREGETHRGYREVQNRGISFHYVGKTWDKLPVAGAPSPRYAHHAFWTGEEMLIWGGYEFPGRTVATNSGGLYNPQTGIWRTVSVENAPSGGDKRSIHWFNDALYVFGCEGPKKYLPSEDTWLELSTSIPPDILCGTESVLTDRQIVFWNVHRQKGASYDLLSNKWKRMKNSCPLTEIDASANLLWNGQNVLFFGGFKAGYIDEELFQAASFSPANGIWKTIDLSRIPKYATSDTVWAEQYLFSFQNVDTILRLHLGSLELQQIKPPLPDAIRNRFSSPPRFYPRLWTGKVIAGWVEDSILLLYDPNSNKWTSFSVNSQ